MLNKKRTPCNPTGVIQGLLSGQYYHFEGKLPSKRFKSVDFGDTDLYDLYVKDPHNRQQFTKLVPLYKGFRWLYGTMSPAERALLQVMSKYRPHLAQVGDTVKSGEKSAFERYNTIEQLYFSSYRSPSMHSGAQYPLIPLKVDVVKKTPQTNFPSPTPHECSFTTGNNTAISAYLVGPYKDGFIVMRGTTSEPLKLTIPDYVTKWGYIKGTALRYDSRPISERGPEVDYPSVVL